MNQIQQALKAPKTFVYLLGQTYKAIREVSPPQKKKIHKMYTHV
jgi:hypothetical protein